MAKKPEDKVISKRFRVDSSWIRSLQYNATDRSAIMYTKGGNVYEYEDVSPQRFNAWLDASSKGKYANKKIKPGYDYNRVR